MPVNSYDAFILSRRANLLEQLSGWCYFAVEYPECDLKKKCVGGEPIAILQSKDYSCVPAGIEPGSKIWGFSFHLHLLWNRIFVVEQLPGGLPRTAWFLHGDGRIGYVQASRLRTRTLFVEHPEQEELTRAVTELCQSFDAAWGWHDRLLSLGRERTPAVDEASEKLAQAMEPVNAALKVHKLQVTAAEQYMTSKQGSPLEQVAWTNWKFAAELHLEVVQSCIEVACLILRGDNVISANEGIYCPG